MYTKNNDEITKPYFFTKIKQDNFYIAIRNRSA